MAGRSAVNSRITASGMSQSSTNSTRRRGRRHSQPVWASPIAAATASPPHPQKQKVGVVRLGPQGVRRTKGPIRPHPRTTRRSGDSKKLKNANCSRCPDVVCPVRHEIILRLQDLGGRVDLNLCETRSLAAKQQETVRRAAQGILATQPRHGRRATPSCRSTEPRETWS